jgi:ABC-type multidrug transport system permease subunit
MGFIWITALKDLRRFWRQPLTLAVWVGIPLMVGVLMISLFGGREGPRPQAYVLVADEDDSFLSGALVGMLSQEAAGDYVRAERVTREVGRARIEKGDGTALLIIPAGFGEAVLREDSCTLRLITNPSQVILPRIVEEGLSIVADGSFYAHRLVGEDLRRFADGPPGGANVFADSTVAEFSVRVNRLSDRLAHYLDPTLITMEDAPPPEEAAETDSVATNAGMIFLPTLLFMALLFMAQGLGNEYWEEDRLNTLRRVLVSPRGVPAFVGAKLLAAFALMLCVSLIALAAGYAYLRLNWSTLPPVLLWAGCAGTALTTLFTLLQLFAASQRAAHILGMSLLFPLMFLGGSFFPVEVMPDWMAAVTRWTPNGWALMWFKRIMLAEAGPGPLAAAFAALLAGTLVLAIICGWRLRRRFARG